jgi:hypothetical protein
MAVIEGVVIGGVDTHKDLHVQRSTNTIGSWKAILRHDARLP